MKMKIGKDATHKVRMDPQFKKDVKRIKKRKKPLQPLFKAIRLLAAGKKLPGHYRDHPLKREWTGFRECHIAADWLLV